ncbi:MAG: L-threonylcarbamoyladenylate synthase [Minisyncoccia bacterium]
MSFKDRVLKILRKIPQGSFLTYQKVAELSLNKKASRAVGNLMAKNKNKDIPCHRVIKSNYDIGGYKGSLKKSYLKAGLLLKEGAIGVIPTDTIYGICGSALNKKTVEKIYKLRKRNSKKPMIILISSLKDLKFFKIKLKRKTQKILKKIWPAKISVILPCKLKQFFYLHKGTNSLAFRIPKNRELLKILEISGPVVAPSANFEGEKPAETINEARKYFKDKVFYYNKGKLKGKPSTLIDFTSSQIKILRKGQDYKKVLRIILNRNKNAKIK